MPLKKDSSASYDQGTGKVKARSEDQVERTYEAPALESTGRVEQNTEPVTTTAEPAPAPREKAVQSAENKAIDSDKPARKSK